MSFGEGICQRSTAPLEFVTASFFPVPHCLLLVLVVVLCGRSARHIQYKCSLPGPSEYTFCQAVRLSFSAGSCTMPDPFITDRPDVDSNHWLTNWIRSKMEHPAEREEKVRGFLLKAKEQAQAW